MPLLAERLVEAEEAGWDEEGTGISITSIPDVSALCIQ